jgi:hypothetical protein
LAYSFDGDVWYTYVDYQTQLNQYISIISKPNYVLPLPSPTQTPTNTETPTNTPTQTPTNTGTPANTPTNTMTPSITPSTSSTIFTAKMVAVGGTVNNVAYSLDGFNWSASTTGNNLITSTYANTVEVNGSGSMFVVGGGSSSTNRLIYSIDGINWSASTSGNSILTRETLSLSWSMDRWLAGGSLTDLSGKIAYSNDGITWTGSTSTVGWIYGFARNSSRWVAGGGIISVGDNVLYYSDDNGVTWSQSSNGPSLIASVDSVSWGNNRFVAVGNNGEIKNTIIVSYDGITWSAATSYTGVTGPFGVLYSVDYDGSKFVAAGNTTNRIIYSTDGFTWFASNNGNSIFTTEVSEVMWNGDQWVAAGQGTNTIAVSNNGLTWTGSTNGNSIFVIAKGITSKDT